MRNTRHCGESAVPGWREAESQASRTATTTSCRHTLAHGVTPGHFSTPCGCALAQGASEERKGAAQENKLKGERSLRTIVRAARRKKQIRIDIHPARLYDAKYCTCRHVSNRFSRAEGSNRRISRGNRATAANTYCGYGWGGWSRRGAVLRRSRQHAAGSRVRASGPPNCSTSKGRISSSHCSRPSLAPSSRCSQLGAWR